MFIIAARCDGEGQRAATLIADDRDNDFSPVRRSTMFEQKYPLPGTQQQFAFRERDGLVCVRKHTSNM